MAPTLVTADLHALALDRRFIGWALVWTVVALLAFGLVAAIIPNPVFGRQIPPEPFAIATWVLSAPLMGLVAATYSAPPRQMASTVARSFGPEVSPATRPGTTLGSIGAIGAFLAIGCPVCNKVALLMLGAGGALTVYAPLQPVIGAASLGLLAVTTAWRFRLRSRGGSCPV